MSDEATQLAKEGFVVLKAFISDGELEQVLSEVADSTCDEAGDRRFLDREWCRLLAHVVRLRLLKCRLLYRASQPVLCTYFNKDQARNWSVGLHRDLHLPLASEVDDANWANWSLKQDIPHARAPQSLLAKMLAVRIHLDDCAAGDGELEVVPRSHLSGENSGTRVACLGARGSAIVLSPLVLHASVKIRSVHSRRVLHFLFGPSTLEGPAQWYYANV